MSGKSANSKNKQTSQQYPKQQNDSAPQSNSSKGLLNQSAFQRNKYLQDRVGQLEKQINELNLKKCSHELSSNNQFSQQKLIDELLQKHKDDLQRINKQKQDFINRIEQEHKKEIEAKKTALDKRYKNQWQQKFDALNKKNSNLQIQIGQLKKKQLDYNKILADKNQLEMLKQKYIQSEEKNKKITDKLINDQKELIAHHKQLEQSTNRSLSQLKKVNQSLKAEVQKARNFQNTKYIQKIKSLQASVDYYIEIIGEISELQKNIQNAEIKKTVKLFTIQLSYLKKTNDEVRQRRLGSNLKTIVNQVVSHVKSLQNDILRLNQQSVGKIKSLQNQKTTLLRQKDETNRKLNEAEQKLRISQDETQNCKKQLKKKSDDKQAEQKKLKDKISQLQTKIIGLQNQVRQKDIQTNKNQQKIAQLQTKVESLNQNISQNQKKIQKLDILLKESKNHIEKLQQDFNSLSCQNCSLKDEISKLNKKIVQIQKKLKDKENSLKEKENSLKEKENKIIKLQEQNSDLRAKKTQHQNQIRKLNCDIQKLKNQHMRQTNHLNAKFSKEVKELKDQINQHRSDKEELESDIRRLRCFEDFCSQINKKFVNELADHMGRTKITLDINQYGSIQKALKQFKKLYNQIRYFSGTEVLDGLQVNFVVDAISKFTQKTIDETKLIYRLDPKSQTNFHQYIDGKQNLVMVVKLINNYVVGGYSERALQKHDKESVGKIATNQGILLGITNSKVFHIKRLQSKNNPQVLIHDDFYFIFGNAEMRIKVHEKKFFSNFGVAASTFDCQGSQKKDFIGENTSELPLITYEFYQIKFRS